MSIDMDPNANATGCDMLNRVGADTLQIYSPRLGFNCLNTETVCTYISIPNPRLQLSHKAKGGIGFKPQHIKNSSRSFQKLVIWTGEDHCIARALIAFRHYSVGLAFL